MRIRDIKFNKYNEYYFSFGFGMYASNGQCLKDCYVKVKALSEQEARNIMYEYWGNIARFLKIYTEPKDMIGMIKININYNIN